MTTLFISDLHLEADRPEIGEQFLDFLNEEAADTAALYILGDFFEYWVGDDDPDEYYASIKRSLRAFTDAVVPVYFMHGNRDFMIGERFAAETGVTILPDPFPLELYGKSVLLSHGDALCTDDTEYQQMRAMTRNPEWQAMMLAKPLEEVPGARQVLDGVLDDGLAGHGQRFKTPDLLAEMAAKGQTFYGRFGNEARAVA